MNKIYLHFFINEQSLFNAYNGDALFIMNLLYGSEKGPGWNELPVEKIKMLKEIGYVVYTRKEGSPWSTSKEFKV